MIPGTIGLQAADGRVQDAHSVSKDVYDFSKISTLPDAIISNLLSAAKGGLGLWETLVRCHGLVD